MRLLLLMGAGCDRYDFFCVQDSPVTRPRYRRQDSKEQPVDIGKPSDLDHSLGFGQAGKCDERLTFLRVDCNDFAVLCPLPGAAFCRRMSLWFFPPGPGVLERGAEERT